MAQNRLYLKCAICGESIAFARLGLGYPSDWEWLPRTEQEYNAFLKKHTYEYGGEGNNLCIKLESEGTDQLVLVGQD